MASKSAIETWPGFETVTKQRLAHTQLRLNTISAESFLSRRVKKGSSGRVISFIPRCPPPFSLDSPKLQVRVIKVVQILVGSTVMLNSLYFQSQE